MDKKMYTSTGKREEIRRPDEKVIDKPKPETIEKYDRFQWGDEIIEYTGFSPFIDKEEVFFFAGVNGGGVKKLRLFSEEDLKSSEFKKLPPPLNHPTVLEAARLTRDKPEIRAQFARALATQFTASTRREKRKIIELLRENLPKALRNRLICGELCGQCPECSKRIWKGDNVKTQRGI